MQIEGFVFDYAKCVGCHACIVACYVENKTEPPVAWRQVNTCNSKKIPLAGYLNLSSACYHCIEAPCLKACPAIAYVKDEQTGAIVHQSEKCIGCRYCTWACPFDAPKYNAFKGVVEKCHLCNHLISKGLKPACAKHCPTGALSYGLIDLSTCSGFSEGLPNTSYQPRIKTLRSSVVESIPQVDVVVTGFEKESALYNADSNYLKIHAKDEWPLILFTFIFPFLVGWIFFFKSYEGIVLKVVFAALGAIGLLLSTFHLGKPLRAPRSLLNLKSSWLSREIFLGGLFLFLALVYLYILKSNALLLVTSIFGLLFLISIEMVYAITKKRFSTPIHSSNTILTALMFSLYFLGLWKILFAAITLKAILYIIRKGYSLTTLSLSFVFLLFIRILFGLIIPMGLIGYSTSQNNSLLLFGLLMGELIDRYEFYTEIYIDTPTASLDQFCNNYPIKE